MEGPSAASESRVQQHLNTESRKSAQPERNTLDAVKRDLLRRSDWMGLTAARPLQMNFPSAQELENIGRRRRTTMEDKKRQEGPHRRRHQHPALDTALHPRQDQYQPDDMRLEYASIRMGSKMHQSQTTRMPSRSRKATSVMPPSGSSQSMLLDKELSTSHQPAKLERTPRLASKSPRCAIKQPRRTSFDSSLLSLDQIRDSETFDEVKAKSDSFSTQNLVIQQRSDSRRLRRRAANRSSISEEVKSSSIVVGRRLLLSTPSHSKDSESHRNITAELPRTIAGQKPPPLLPDSLSSDFLPPTRSHDDKDEKELRHSSCGNHKIPFQSSPVLPNTAGMHVATNAIHGQLSNRSKFTLELQVESEEQAVKRQAATADVLVAGRQHPKDTHGISGEDHSHHRICTKDAGTDRYKISRPIGVMGEEKVTSLTNNQLFLTNSDHPRTEAQNNTAIRPQMAQGLRSTMTEKGPNDANRNAAEPFDFSPRRQGSLKDTRLTLRNSTRPMLGTIQRPQNAADERYLHDAAAQSEENQAWMRFILQDDPKATNDNFFTDPNFNAYKPRDTSYRWLRLRSSDDQALSENHELQTTQRPSDIISSPGQTIRTAANTIIRGADLVAGTTPLAPSETDFLSQLSPMEGHLDERLFNPSVYANPARTERSYIAAPNHAPKLDEKGPQTIDQGRGRTDVNGSSRTRLPHACPEVQVSGDYSSIASSPCSEAARKGTSADKRWTEPISNLFTNPKHSTFQPLLRTADASIESFHSPSKMFGGTEKRRSGGQWIPPPSTAGTSLSIPRHRNTFPMNYAPAKHTTNKSQPEHFAFRQHSDSYHFPPQSSRDLAKVIAQSNEYSLHSSTSSNPPSSSHLTVSKPDTSNVSSDFFPASPSLTNKYENNPPNTGASPPIALPSHNNLFTPPQAFSNPPTPSHSPIQQTCNDGSPRPDP